MSLSLFECIGGSYLYGTNSPDSDQDFRGVYLEDPRFILGLHKQDHHVETKEQDLTHYSLRFFTNLLIAANPNILELIFVENATVWTKQWEQFRDVAREYAISQKVRNTFAGYARSQLKKINTHYKWMTGEPPKKPLPEDYGRTFHGEKEIWTDYQLKMQYDKDKNLYEHYQQWLKNRNAKRHELEAKYGYDTKNGLHLVRLLTEAKDILTKGYLEFPLHNADFLKKVKSGYFTYSEIITWSDEYFEYIKTVDSDIQNKPNVNKMEEIVMKIYREYIRGAE